MDFTKYYGVFNPVDLETVQQEFDRLCAELGVAQGDLQQREALAAEFLHGYQQDQNAEPRQALA